MIYSVLFIACVSAFFSVTEQSTCRKLIICPCGNTGKNTTFCEDRSEVNNPCTKFSNCKKCQYGLPHCLECPDGFKGPFCSKRSTNKLNFRQSRQIPTDTRPHVQGIYATHREGTCPNLDAPKLGSIRCISGNGQKSCIGKCLPGYKFENKGHEAEIVLSCQNGVWMPKNQFSACKSAGYCDLEVQGPGSYNCTVDVKGTRCDVYCAGSHTGIFNCVPGKTWNPPLPNCVRAKDVQAEDKIIQLCLCENGGTCDPQGKCICQLGWRGQFCELVLKAKKPCDDPGFISNGNRMNLDRIESTVHRRFADGESLVFECMNETYALRGYSFITCKDGSWSGSLPKCIKAETTPEITCSSPQEVPNAQSFSTNGSHFVDAKPNMAGFSVMYTCLPGYSLQGNGLITCLESGFWSDPFPSCKPIPSPSPTTMSTTVDVGSIEYCLNPGRIRNGGVIFYPSVDSRTGSEITLDEAQYPEGSRLRYYCDKGYTLQGSGTLLCEAKGDWSAKNPTCVTSSNRKIEENTMYCEDPGMILDGKVRAVSPEDGSTILEADLEYPEGTRLQYSCDKGLSLKGPSELLCLSTGYWSTDLPFCSNDTN